VLVGRLITQRTTQAVLLSAEQRAVPVAGVAEVGAQLDNQTVAVDQYRAPPATFTEYGQVLIVAGEVDVFNLERKGLADAEAKLGNETEQQPVTATMGGMAARMAATSPVRKPRGAGGSRRTRSTFPIGSARMRS
jgi:hypothetical protein